MHARHCAASITLAGLNTAAYSLPIMLRRNLTLQSNDNILKGKHCSIPRTRHLYSTHRAAHHFSMMPCRSARLGRYFRGAVFDQ